MFFGIFSPAQLGSRPTLERINGGYYWQNDTAGATLLFNFEADFDFEYTIALTDPQPVINYQVSEQWQIGTLNGLLAALDPSYCTAWNSSIDGTYPSPIEGGYPGPMACGTVKPASVISVSYAWHEVEYPAAYLRRQCLEFLKLGLQGVSAVVASGDCGPVGVGCRCIDPRTGGVTPEQADSGLFNPSCRRPARTFCPSTAPSSPPTAPSTTPRWRSVPSRRHTPARPAAVSATSSRPRRTSARPCAATWTTPRNKPIWEALPEGKT